MARNDLHFCPACNTKHQLLLDHTVLLACVKCSAIIYVHPSIDATPDATPVPGDWSFIRPGTQGEHADLKFTIVGRARLQLRNEYKNFWCAAMQDGKNLWIVESFGSFMVMNPGWMEYTESPNYLRAGKTIPISKEVKHAGEYVEKCESISFQGEIARWKFFRGGFFVVQAGTSAKAASVFVLDPKIPNDIGYLIGRKADLDSLKLTNIISWNEWV